MARPDETAQCRGSQPRLSFSFVSSGNAVYRCETSVRAVAVSFLSVESTLETPQSNLPASRDSANWNVLFSACPVAFIFARSSSRFNFSVSFVLVSCRSSWHSRYCCSSWTSYNAATQSSICVIILLPSHKVTSKSCNNACCAPKTFEEEGNVSVVSSSSESSAHNLFFFLLSK